MISHYKKKGEKRHTCVRPWKQRKCSLRWVLSSQMQLIVFCLYPLNDRSTQSNCPYYNGHVRELAVPCNIKPVLSVGVGGTFSFVIKCFFLTY